MAPPAGRAVEFAGAAVATSQIRIGQVRDRARSCSRTSGNCFLFGRAQLKIKIPVVLRESWQTVKIVDFDSCQDRQAVRINALVEVGGRQCKRYTFRSRPRNSRRLLQIESESMMLDFGIGDATGLRMALHVTWEGTAVIRLRPIVQTLRFRGMGKNSKITVYFHSDTGSESVYLFAHYARRPA